MELYRCPSCNHWRCRECTDRMALWLTCCKCRRESPVKDWYQRRRKGGRPHDLDKPLRFGSGRAPDASKALAESLTLFCKRYGIPLRAFGGHTRISPWAVRQAKAGKRSLPRIQETLIKATMQRIREGRFWLRRVSKQRWDLVQINPPYRPSCPMSACYCTGALLPGDCPKLWNECPISGKNWQEIERIHQAHRG